MEARYLRVKNWARFQHYDPTQRRVLWFKFYNDLLTPGDAFVDLTELEQWQLVRIWLVASRSGVLTRDENGRPVPVVVDNEQSLRRSTMSLKPIPLAKFMRQGWLIPVGPDELLDAAAASEPASTPDSDAASSGDSGPLKEQENLEKELANASSLPATIDRPPKLTRLNGADLAFDTLQRLTGIDSRSQRTREVAVALSGSRGKPGIRRMFWEEQGGVKGEGFERMLAAEIEQRCALYRRKMPGAALTPTAVQKWWFDMVGLPDPHDGRVLSIEERLWRHAGELEADERRSLDAG